jgi:hypothetical protein
MSREYLVYLLSVVDFPDDGLPTRPIKGSRGIIQPQYPEEEEKRVIEDEQ